MDHPIEFRILNFEETHEVVEGICTTTLRELGNQ
jgi:hypothetical protein